MNRQAQDAFSPPDGVGVQRLADTGDEPQPREAVPGGELRAGLDQHADRGGRGVPDGDALVLQDAVPPLGVELGFVDDRRDTVQQWGDDPVGGPGDPSRVGRAPERVVVVQVQRVQTGEVVHHDRAVDVDGTLGGTGGAAGEVEQGRVVGRGVLDRRGVVGGVHQVPEVQRAAIVVVGFVVVDNEDVPNRRQLVANLGDLALIDPGGGDEHGGLADPDARGDGFGAEGREQRRDDAAVAQGAEHGDVQLGPAAHDGEDLVALVDAQRAQHIGELPRHPSQLRVSEVAGGGRAVPGRLGDEPQRSTRGRRAVGVTIQRGERDVAPARTHALAQRRHLGPAEVGSGALVVTEIRRNPEVPGPFCNDVHGGG